jgi:hypothetical protein
MELGTPLALGKPGLLTAEPSLDLFGTWPVAEVRLRLADVTTTIRRRSLCFADEWGRAEAPHTKLTARSLNDAGRLLRSEPGRPEKAGVMKKIIGGALAITSGTLAVAVTLLAGANGALGAGTHSAKPSFKASHWTVTIDTSSVLGTPLGSYNKRAKPGGGLTLCNMDRLGELAIDYRFRNTTGNQYGKHGLLLPYTLIISGPGGKQKVRFTTPRHNGTGTSGYSVGALPGGALPALPGTYGAQIRQGAKTLMHTTITLTSSNTCS